MVLNDRYAYVSTFSFFSFSFDTYISWKRVCFLKKEDIFYTIHTPWSREGVHGLKSRVRVRTAL